MFVLVLVSVHLALFAFYVFLAVLDSLVPASFNLFCFPVHVCPVFMLSCTVYVGVGVRLTRAYNFW